MIDGPVDNLVALLGKQPMPVMLAIAQYKPRHAFLVVSKETEKQAHFIREAVRLLANTGDGFKEPFQLESVNPYSSEDTKQRIIVELVRHTNSNVLINFTGGTSMMALGAFQAAEKLGCPMLYVDTDENTMIWSDSIGIEQGRREITPMIETEVYLKSHGVDMRINRWGQEVMKGDALTEHFIQAARILGQAGTRGARLLDPIRKCLLNKAYKTGLPTRPDSTESQVAQKLKELEILSNFTQTADYLEVQIDDDPDSQQGKRVREFLMSKWLELYVYDKLKHESNILYDVQLDVTISHMVGGGKHNNGQVTNQIDVLVMCRSRLAAISCKTRYMCSTTGKVVGKQSVYELDSLLQADLMGLYAEKILVTNQPNFSDAVSDRAALSDICMVTGGELPDLVRKVEAVFDNPFVDAH